MPKTNWATRVVVGQRAWLREHKLKKERNKVQHKGWKHRLQSSMRRQASLYLFVGILFASGIAFGALLVYVLGAGSRRDLFSYLSNFFMDMKENTVAEPLVAFRHALMDRLQQLGLMWFLGVTVLGIPFLLGLLFLQRMALGFTISFLVHQLAWRGLGLSFVSVLPHNLLTIPAWLFLAVGGINLSINLLKRGLRPENKTPIYPQFLSFAVLGVFLSVVLTASAAVEAFIVPTLMRYLLPAVTV